MKDFFTIETTYSSEEYKIMSNVLSLGTESLLEGFSKSKFGKSANSNDKFKFEFAVSELPVLYKKMEDLYEKSKNEDVLDFMNEIKEAIKPELEEMIDPYDPMDANQTIDGEPTDSSDLNAIADDTETEMNESELKELIKKRLMESLGTLGLSYTPEEDNSIENFIDDDTKTQELASENSSDSLVNQHGENLKPETLDESHGDKYEQIVFMQGDEANEVMDILNNDGEESALKYLQQWHSPGEHDGSNDIGAGTQDETFEKDGYIMNWNPYLPYIGLVYDTEYVPLEQTVDEDSQMKRHQAGQRGKIGKMPLGQHSPHSQAAKS